MEPGLTQCPGGPPVFDPPGCPLLFSCLWAIKKLTTFVYNRNSQRNIKLTIINTKIPIEANSVLFDSERLYTIWRFVSLVFTLFIIFWLFARYRQAKIHISKFCIQSY